VEGIYEVPKLAVTALVNEQGFAELLDRRLARIEQMKLIQAPQTNGEKVDAKLAPRIPDRRFRRI
jgi:hypothetical protein